MALAALIVAIVSAVAGVGGLALARRSATSAARSADAAAVTAALDVDRRHSELTPRFRLTCEPWNPGIDTLRLRVCLTGPPELERLDELTVMIRDDHPWRGQGTPLAGGPTPEQVAQQIWGRWRFTPRVGPGADSIRGIPGADETGRGCPARDLPVGEELLFQLEPTSPPRWSQQALQSWQEQVGPMLRLRLGCRRDGWELWTLPCEVLIENGVGRTEVPPGNLAQDHLASTQRAELQAGQQRREREQAAHVDVTWNDMPDQPGRSMAILINDSERPIFGVVVRGRVVQNAVSLLPAVQTGEMYPAAIPASMAPPESWTFRSGKPGDRLESLRPGGRGAFICGFPVTPSPDGRLHVRFTDDAGLHWQLDQDHHLERLTERDW